MINEIQTQIVEWRIGKGFETNWENLPVKTMLVITELGRAVDYHRKENVKMVQHELTDGLIRYLDLMGSIGIDTDSMIQKVMKNNKRRVYKHGKKY